VCACVSMYVCVRVHMCFNLSCVHAKKVPANLGLGMLMRACLHGNAYACMLA